MPSRLPEMMLRSAGDVPPMVLFIDSTENGASQSDAVKSRAAALIPSKSSPIQLPAMITLEASYICTPRTESHDDHSPKQNCRSRPEKFSA